MTGERWDWFRVASHLKMTVDELKSRLPWSEFIDWTTFLSKHEVMRDAKNEWYLATIAAEIRRGNVKDPNAVKVEDFFARLKSDEDGGEVVSSPVERARVSKETWAAGLGVSLSKRN